MTPRTPDLINVAVLDAERLRNSSNGNPTWRVLLGLPGYPEQAKWYRTKTDCAFGYEVTNLRGRGSRRINVWLERGQVAMGQEVAG